MRTKGAPPPKVHANLVPVIALLRVEVVQLFLSRLDRALGPRCVRSERTCRGGLDKRKDEIPV
jgi:hypothetical protein